MNVEVFLTGSTVTEDDVRDRTVVVVDVLRASSTIVTALHHGARAVVAVEDMAQAGQLAAAMDADSTVLGGERDGDKIEGYQLGNSPLEYTEEAVKGRTVVLTTTNGTRAISRSVAGEDLVVGSFLNAERVVDFLLEKGRDITIVCAGWRNRISYEDTLCAGLLLHRLWDGEEPGHVSDSAHTAFTLYLCDGPRRDIALRHAHHARRLVEKGFADDVDYCFRLDALDALPLYDENRLILAP